MIMFSVLGAKANTLIEEIDESSVRLLISFCAAAAIARDMTMRPDSTIKKMKARKNLFRHERANKSLQRHEAF